MADQSKKRSKKRTVNPAEKEEIVKKKLTEFYSNEIFKDQTLKKSFNTETAIFLGAGAFGHVFLVTAKKDVTFDDLEAITISLGKDEKHEFLNQVEALKAPNKSDVVLRKNQGVAMKCETAFLFQVENFPITPKNLPDADPERFSVYKEYNTLNNIFSRFGYKDTRGFTRPYAFGHLGDYTYMHIESSKKTKMYGFHFLMFEICGPDMEDMMEICSYNCRQNEQRLSTRTVFMVGDQFLSRMQCIQDTSLGLTHNDLKCDQLMTGKAENGNTIYLIDYGLVSKYKETWTSTLVAPLGNRRWAPRSNHQMAPRTPLCEIESSCYVLLRLLKNHFPWDGMFDRQMMKLQELKDRGEEDMTVKTGDEVLYEEKQYLWFFLKKESGKKLGHMPEDVEQEIEKYKDFFEERNDKWGDGGSQMKDLMVDMAKMGDSSYCGFVEKKIDFADVNYIGIRKHLLNIFDLSMYAHNLETAGLTGLTKLNVENFFKENKEKKHQRTECGRPVYYYFPEGEHHCYFEWFCRSKDFWENKPEYWHKLLANRDELADMLKRRQAGQKSPAAPASPAAAAGPDATTPTTPTPEKK